MLKVLPIPIPILLQKVLSILLTNTFTDTFNVVTSPIRNFMVFKSSVCEDYYFVKHVRGSKKYKRNIKLSESADDGWSLRARETDSFSCWYFPPFSTVSSMRLLQSTAQTASLCVCLKLEATPVTPRGKQMHGRRILSGRLTADGLFPVSYTHLTLPTKRIV